MQWWWCDAVMLHPSVTRYAPLYEDEEGIWEKHIANSKWVNCLWISSTQRSTNVWYTHIAWFDHLLCFHNPFTHNAPHTSLRFVICRAMTGIKAEYLVWTWLYRKRVWYKSVKWVWDMLICHSSLNPERVWLVPFPAQSLCNSLKVLTLTKNRLQACLSHFLIYIYFMPAKVPLDLWADMHVNFTGMQSHDVVSHGKIFYIASHKNLPANITEASRSFAFKAKPNLEDLQYSYFLLF